MLNKGALLDYSWCNYCVLGHHHARISAGTEAEIADKSTPGGMLVICRSKRYPWQARTLLYDDALAIRESRGYCWRFS
jgi:hypothetical protein